VSTLKRLAAGMIVALVLISLVPATTAGATGSGCNAMNDTERAFKHRINAARGESRGRLWGDKDLNKVALKHTREMIARSRLYHTPENAFRRRVTNWSMLGENVGVGGSVRSLHKAFMSSSAHRANAMNKTFNRIGVGALRNNGRLWVTIIFEAKSNPGSPLCS
jgi:uncharacterized protein YkwD